MKHLSRRSTIPTARAGTLGLALSLTLVLTAATAAAEERTLTLDPAKTRITFTLGATLHTVAGSFALERGSIRFDLEAGSASGEVIADATSGDTGNGGRDRDMHAKVLESERFPRFTLVPTGVTGRLGADGSGEITLSADLTVHGGSHAVEIPTEVTHEGTTLRARGSFTVPYVEWGMTDPSKFVLRVDKTVEVRIEAVGELGD